MSLLTLVQWLALALLVLGLLARFIWYSTRRRNATWFPSWKVCSTVHRNLPLWTSHSKSLLSYKPGATVLGFFLTPIWLLIISLNILLLAQVLEVFFGEGIRFQLPWVGYYTMFPIILGGLLAISYTVFAVLLHHIRNRFLQSLLVFLIFVMIIGEAGLAYYRAWLLSVGEELISPSMMDMIIYRAGPILAALIAASIAISETLTGRYSFQEFLEPMLMASTRWTAGVLGLLWSAIAWWLFGFHDFIIDDITIKTIPQKPRWYSEIKNQIEALSDRKKQLNDHLKNLQRSLKSWPEAPESLEQLETRLTDLHNSSVSEHAKDAEKSRKISETVNLHIKWSSDITKYQSALCNANSLMMLKTIKGDLKRHRFVVLKDWQALKAKALQLAAYVNTLPKEFSNRDSKLKEISGALDDFKQYYSEYSAELVQTLRLFESKDISEYKSDSLNTVDYHTFLGNLNNHKAVMDEMSTVLKGSADEYVALTEEHALNKFSKQKYDVMLGKMLAILKNDIPLLKRDGLNGLANLRREFKAKRKTLRRERLRAFFRRNRNNSLNTDSAGGSQKVSVLNLSSSQE